jgi:hypothetical protein
MLQLIPYEFNCQVYYESSRVPVPERTNGLVITNIGDAICEVEGISLLPGVPGTTRGDSFSIGGNLGEVLAKKQVSLSFGAGATPRVEIVFKVYPETVLKRF